MGHVRREPRGIPARSFDFAFSLSARAAISRAALTLDCRARTCRSRGIRGGGALCGWRVVRGGMRESEKRCELD